MSLQEIETSLTRSLTTIVTHWDQMLTPRSSGSIARGTGAAVTLADDHSDTETDTPRLERLLSLRREVTDCLNGWARLVAEDRGISEPLVLCKHPKRVAVTLLWPKVGPTLPQVRCRTKRGLVGRNHVVDGNNVEDLLAFLAQHAQWFAGHEAAQDAADELRPLAARVKATVDPPRKDWVNIGTCPLFVSIDGEAHPCRTPLRAYPGKGKITCRGCGFENDIVWWEAVIVPDASRLLTANELPEFVRQQFGKTIKAPTVRKWIERHVITAAGTDDKGRTLYDKGAVAYALARRQMAL